MSQATPNGAIPHDGVPNCTYGFIGVGVMGNGMAKNLRSKMPPSAKLLICEVNKARRDEFFATTEGLLEVAESPKELAKKADIIITMLPRGEHVLDVFTNPSTGLLSISQGGDQKFFLECSTIETSTSVEVGKMVAKSGLGVFVDSPVSGGPEGSDAGTLTFMIGGPTELYEKAKPILAMMGKRENIFHCGKEGAGLATKQINNYCAWVSFLGLCEGMNTGILYGLDPKVLASVINVSSGMSFNSLHMNPVKGVNPNSSAARDFEGGFLLELCRGVNDMAIQLGKEVGARSVLAPVVQGIFERAAVNDKCKGKECRSVYKMFAENGGKDLDGML